MSDAEDKINQAPEEARPALMNLDHRIIRLESAVRGDRESGQEGLGKTINALQAQLSVVEKKLETLLTKLSVVAALAAVILPILTRYIQKIIGF